MIVKYKALSVIQTIELLWDPFKVEKIVWSGYYRLCPSFERLPNIKYYVVEEFRM